SGKPNTTEGSSESSGEKTESDSPPVQKPVASAAPLSPAPVVTIDSQIRSGTQQLQAIRSEAGQLRANSKGKAELAVIPKGVTLSDLDMGNPLEFIEQSSKIFQVRKQGIR